MNRKSVLITGATRNTGYITAQWFAKEGWAVFITSLNGKDAERAAKEISDEFGTPCYGMEYDTLNYNDAERLVQWVKEKGYVLDSLVLNAAAQGLNHNPLTVSADDWAKVVVANVVGGFALARGFARQMIENGKQGTIVFLGSICYQDCNVDRSSYNASKGGILSLTKSLAVDFGQFGIRVNCLMPGPIYTDRYDKLDEETRQRRNALVPIGRVSTGEDVAGGVWFLATELSGNMTGSGVIMDGGVDCINSGRY